VRRVEQLVKEAAEKTGKPSQIRKGTTDPQTLGLESKLREVFGTKVIIRTRPDGGGEITLEYYSLDDLDRLLDLFDIIKQRNRL
jgi:ParB family transcriptional regulator, chromosome partitioning protein